MLAEPPLISCIVPVYNGARYLGAALESVLAQGWQPLELLVVDDGSTDSTPAIAARFGPRLRYLRQARGGPAAARNHGLRQARGELIVFQDADDLWPAGRLTRQADRFAADPQLQILVGRAQCVRLEAGALQPLAEPALMFSVTSAMMRRRAFDILGGFDESLHTSDDVDWFLRAREADLRLEVEAACNVLYRRHDENITGDRPAALGNFLRALKLSLDRRRPTGGAAPLLPPLEGTP